MADGLDFYINMLANNAGALSATSALKSLDATVKTNDASIKGLEKSYSDAMAKAKALDAAGDTKKAAKAAREAEKIQTEIGRRSSANAAAEAKASAIATKSAAAQAAAKQKEIDLARKQEVASAKHSVAMEKARTQWAKLSKETDKTSGAVENAESNWKAMKSAVGSGGAAGAAIAVAVALALAATAVVACTVALAKYALVASDAARSSQLLSAAATGSGSAGWELETVVDQLSNKIPQARQKTAEWARELALANIAGRDMQRTLTTMGTVASAVGDSAAGKIKGIAEASRMAQKLMLGARDRFGEFASLQGTGIKAADIYAAVAKSMRTSIPEAKRMVDAGIVPFKRGLEALERAAETKFGPIVARQMMSLSTQAEKLKENIGKLFSGANIESFLAGLKTVTDLFDTNTVTGYVLREVFTAVFTKIAELASKVFPYVKAAIEGVVVGVLIFAIAAKQLYRQFQETFGGAGKGIDGMALAFKIGVGIVATMVGSIVALTAAFAILGTVALIALAPIWVPIAITMAVIYLAITAIGAFIDAVTSIGEEIAKVDLAAAAGKMMDGLIKGIKDKVADVKSAILEVSGAITGAFNSDQEIRSPGRKAMRQGKYVVEGHAIGMEQNVPMVERASLEVSRAATGSPSQGGGAQSRGGFNPEKVELHFHVTEAGDLPAKVREVLTEIWLGEARGWVPVPS